MLISSVIRCDFPGCLNECTVEGPDGADNLPLDWRSVMCQDYKITDICPLHEGVTDGDIVSIMALKKRFEQYQKLKKEFEK